MNSTRRKFLLKSGQLSLGLGFMGLVGCQGGAQSTGTDTGTDASSTTESMEAKELFFKISLAQWSLNKSLFGGKLDNLDFAKKAKEDFGIEGIEYVNQFFKDKATDMDYLKQMKQRAEDHGVQSLLIMIDREGNLGATSDEDRKQAVENHFKWVDAAKFLGCHSIRVNAAGKGTREEVAAAAVDGLGKLSEYAATAGLNVIVENHGGYSSDGTWLSGVMKEVNLENCGTLPDFGNFCIERGEDGCANMYDRYQGVTELMPFAKAVSAKSHDFNDAGMETNTDFLKMMKIVKEFGYSGFVGIEYEGSGLSEDEGIKATKALLEKVGMELS